MRFAPISIPARTLAGIEYAWRSQTPAQPKPIKTLHGVLKESGFFDTHKPLRSESGL
jgi:hypothetical protein